MNITIKHTRQQGTLVFGTSRGDGAGRVLHVHTFRPSSNLPDDEELGEAYWYLPHSRRHHANRWKIAAAKSALEAAGFTVDVRIDDITAASGFADLETERYQRAEDRADHLAARAGQAAASSEKIRAGNEIAYGALNGTPILIGHHSEQRHRNLLDKLWRREGKAWALLDQAERLMGRADAASAYQGRRQSHGTTLRRIKKLEARLRQIGRDLEGRTEHLWDNPDSWPGPLEPQLQLYRDNGIPVTITGSHTDPDGTRTVDVHIGLSEMTTSIYAAEIAETLEELSYWHQVIKDSGRKVWGRADFVKGDFAVVGKHLHEVVRVGERSVSVPHRWEAGVTVHTMARLRLRARHPSTGTIPYDEITGKRAAAEVRAEFPDAFPDAILHGQKLPPRPAARRGSVKITNDGHGFSECWLFRIGPTCYSAVWRHPEGWFGPPVPVADPDKIKIYQLGQGSPRLVTELPVPAGIRWREEVFNLVRDYAESIAAGSIAAGQA